MALARGSLLRSSIRDRPHPDTSWTGRNYSIGRGTLRRSQELGKECRRSEAWCFQHTDDDLLPSSEQFFIGGEYSVRGYRPGTFAGDQGIHGQCRGAPSALCIERRRAGRPGDDRILLFDHGYVKPFRPPNSLLRSYERLSSVGWGLNASVMKRVTTRLTFAYALNDLPLEPRRYEIHFQIAASLF
jgi:hemolysin activation/secretion protein